MKLNKIYISAFGGLKDFTLDLCDGLNVIYGNNEDGKSTVAAFIKAMFYGTGRNTKNLADSVRLKYTPWDNSTMAGRIFFENGGKRYCLEREFRRSDSTDRISLTDLDSGKTVDTAENIGQQFFGMSAAAFERSLFIGNGDFIKDDAATGEINGKLSNIAVTGSEDVSYKKIEKNIFDTRAKLISKSGRSGSYNEDIERLSELEARLEKADYDAKTKSLLNEKAQQKRTEYEELYKKYSELKQTLDREQDFKNRERLAEFLESKRRLDQLNASLTLNDGTVINENFTAKVEFGISKYEKTFERCEQIKSDIAQMNEAIALQNSASPEGIKAQIEELTKELESLTEQKAQFDKQQQALTQTVEQLNQKLEAAQNKKSAFNPALLISSLILAAFGASTLFFSPILAAGIIGIAAILLALSFVFKPKNTAAVNAVQNELNQANCSLAESRTQKNALQEQINNINAKMNTLSSVFQADAAVKQQRLVDLQQKNDALQSEQGKLQTAKDEVLSLVSGFDGIDSIEKAREKLAELIEKTQKQKEIKLQLKTASQFLGNIDYDTAANKLNAMQNEALDENLDFDTVKREFEITAEKLSGLKEELTVIATELKTSFKASENPEDLKREIVTLKEKADSKKAFCDAADLAIEVLEQSFYELRRGYGSELEKATHDIFSRLTNGRYKSVSISDTLDLSVEKSDVFGTRELEYLSLGTTHQAYLSLRLAIASLIGDNSLPVFLDDSLSQYDDSRTEEAIKFLKEFCKDSQGILFTCHNSICDIAKANGIEIQKPYK